VEILTLCPKLKSLTLSGNPAAEAPDYVERIKQTLPQLTYLDEKRLYPKQKPRPLSNSQDRERVVQFAEMEITESKPERQKADVLAQLDKAPELESRLKADTPEHHGHPPPLPEAKTLPDNPKEPEFQFEQPPKTEPPLHEQEDHTEEIADLEEDGDSSLDASEEEEQRPESPKPPPITFSVLPIIPGLKDPDDLDGPLLTDLLGDMVDDRPPTSRGFFGSCELPGKKLKNKPATRSQKLVNGAVPRLIRPVSAKGRFPV
jgi:hypothetical protein